MLPKLTESLKRSTGRRKGDEYEKLLLALLCLKMTQDQGIFCIRHEVRDLEPADDIVVEYDTRIECYQAKHSTNPHSLLDLEELTGSSKLGLGRLWEVWKQLRGKYESIEIHIYTNRAAGPDLARILDDNRIKRKVLNRKESVRIYNQLVEAVSLSSGDDILVFLRSLRFDLREPNVDELETVIKEKWLRDRLGLDPEVAYNRLFEHVDGWFLESKSRPIERKEVFGALQVDKTSLRQKFPVDQNTFIPRPEFEEKVLKTLKTKKRGYLALVGAPGSGKSTFIAELIRRTRGRRIRIIRYYCFTHVDDINYRSRMRRDEFLKSLIEQLYRECSDLLPPDDHRYEYSPERLNAILADVGSALDQEGEYLFFIVDGLDHLARNPQVNAESILDVFPRQIPEGIICLLGCQGLQYLPEFIKRECQNDRTFELPLFTLRQTHKYLSNHLGNQSPLSLTDIRSIHSKCSGLPLYLHYIAERLDVSESAVSEQLVNQLPTYGRNIESYYGALWNEFGDDSKMQRLCGLAAQLRFSIEKENLIRMAGIEDSLEGERLFRKVEHLFLKRNEEYSLFHESFRGFISNELNELSPAIQEELNNCILAYLNDTDRIHSEPWFQYAHWYANECRDDGYLTKNYEWTYVEKAISNGRDPEEIVNVLRMAVSAACRQKKFVKVAEISLLVAHTATRLSEYLDRNDLLLAMIHMGNSEAVLSAITNDGKGLKLNSPNTELLISIADCEEAEQWQSIADDFIDRLGWSAIDRNLLDAMLELIAIYRPSAVDELAGLIAILPEDTRHSALGAALRRLYNKEKFSTIRTLRKWLQSSADWPEFSEIWYFWIAMNEFATRRDTCIHHIKKAGRITRDSSQSVLLCEMACDLDGGREFAELLLEGSNLSGGKVVSMNDVVSGLNFREIRAYVRILIHLGREQEVDIMAKYLRGEPSLRALYLRTNIKVAAARESDGEALRAALIEFVSNRTEPFAEGHSVRMAIHADLPELLSYVFTKYKAGGGKLGLLVNEVRSEIDGMQNRINGYMLRQSLSRVDGEHILLKQFLQNEYDRIIAGTLETRERTDELLRLAILAAEQEDSILARDCFQRAISASRGYGFRKDPTLRQLMSVLEIAIKRGISDPLTQIAQIADWNLLVAEFTDGKETKWFPHVLYDLTLGFNRENALQLLVTYSKELAAWQFHYAVEQFIATWKEETVEIAYLCTELISEHSWDDPYVSKYKARISLLESVAHREPGHAGWIAKQIRQFLLTEVPPDIRGPFIEQFNEVADEFDFQRIEDASVYNQTEATSYHLSPDFTVTVNDKQIEVGKLAEYMSVSVTVFDRCIHSLGAEKLVFKYIEQISEALEILINKATERAEVERLHEIVLSDKRNELESKSRVILARALWNWSDYDAAKKLCESAFYHETQYAIWIPNLESIQLLADLDPEYAIEMLLSFADQRIQEDTWVGYGTFLVFAKALDLLGEEYTNTIQELYTSYHCFIARQFESIETDNTSPYQWMREKTESSVDFEELALMLVAKEWDTPVLHRREGLINLVYRVALRQPALIIPWLLGLLKNHNRTVAVQVAVVFHSIALRNAELLGDYYEELLPLIDSSHFTQVNHIAGCLESLEMPAEAEKLIRQKLARARPKLVRDPIVISKRSLQSSYSFKERTWKRTMNVVQRIVEDVALTLEMDLSEMQWRIECEMSSMGYSEECSNQKWNSYRNEFIHPGFNTSIPFESYDSLFVWHALNTITEQRVRQSLVDESAVKSLASIMGLYDPVLPMTPAIQKPADIRIPYLGRPSTRTKPDDKDDIIEPWLKFEGESPVTKAVFEEEWVVIVDDYHTHAGCVSEVCKTYSFLAPSALRDAILTKKYSPEQFEGVQQIWPGAPDYCTITKMTAKEILNSGYRIANIGKTNSVPLVAWEPGSFLLFRRYVLTSLAGWWIREYGLEWSSIESLDLCWKGRIVQRFVEWRDGAKAGVYTYRPVGSGTRLSVRSDFLETIMSTYNLSLIIVSGRKRRLNPNTNLSSEPTREEEKQTVRVIENNGT